MRTLPRAMGVIVALLIVAHLGLRAWSMAGHEIPLDLHMIFNVDEEPTVPSWYSTIALFGCALLLVVIAGERRGAGSRDTWYWYGLAAGFTVMSLDEIASFHEAFNTYSSIDWTVPGAVLVGVIALLYAPFVWRLPSRTRIRFLIAGAIYVAGVLGMERVVVDRDLFPWSMDSYAYHIATAIEESLEMAGVVLFIRALLLQMSAESGDPDRVTIEIET